MKLPIGQSDFRTIIDNQFTYVDKSLFIKDIVEDSATVILITRPRRFGKTLNLSTLHHFFAAEVMGKKTAGLFDSLKIAKHKNIMQEQGKYPVIFLTLKDIKETTFQAAYENLVYLMSELYQQHSYLLNSEVLTAREKRLFSSILEQKATQAVFKSALKNLTYYLYRYYDVKPILLIDEYDTPLQSGYVHGYYDKMIEIMSPVLGGALKDNAVLHKAVITGILRISKESIFSGLNNLDVYSLMRNEYSQYFGFTEQEVNILIEQAAIKQHAAAIKNWYNGYQFGNTTIYNPWSIINCLKQTALLQPYWINTSDNALIKRLLLQASGAFKMQFEALLQGRAVECLINESFVFSDLNNNESSIWNLLLFSGYLKPIEIEPIGIKLRCKLLSPNQEISYLYQDTIQGWFTDTLGQIQYQQFIASLTEGRPGDFVKMLKKFLLESSSMFDVKGNNPERFYHGFILGLIASLQTTHLIKSNRESGYGRYDILIIPHDKHQLGIILEFKSVEKDEDLNTAAKEALQQITQRSYVTELKQNSIKRYLKMGLAFKGKEVSAAYENDGKIFT